MKLTYFAAAPSAAKQAAHDLETHQPLLPLHSSRAVAAHEFGHVGDGHAVKIADDAVLEATGCNCEFERRLLVLVMIQAIDQAAREAVAAADTIDDIADFVFLRDVEALAVVQARRPAIPIGAVALAERDGDALHIRIRFQHLITERAVFFAVEFAGFHIRVDRDFKRLLHIFLVGDCNIDILRKLPHDLTGLFAVFPEIFAVIQVAGDGDVPLLCLFYGF